jgi:mRNA interferase MazF
MKKGSVILIPFPFTDLKGSKIRPAVVLRKSKSDEIGLLQRSHQKING